MVLFYMAIHHLCGGKGDKMFDDDDDDEINIDMIDIEASKKTDNEELEKENNPIRQEFNKVKHSLTKVNCLINMLFTALNNEFDTIETDDIINYITLISEHLEEHEKILNKFFNKLNIPDKPAKLIGLRYDKFKH